jgi:hypothetical protein
MHYESDPYFTRNAIVMQAGNQDTKQNRFCFFCCGKELVGEQDYDRYRSQDFSTIR